MFPGNATQEQIFEGVEGLTTSVTDGANDMILNVLVTFGSCNSRQAGNDAACHELCIMPFWLRRI